jgi:GntR family transcriptional regulator
VNPVILYLQRREEAFGIREGLVDKRTGRDVADEAARADRGMTLPPPSIDRDSPVPFYFQLGRVLEEEIVSGRWPVGHRLESEPTLGEHFGVSRSVIRQALDRLERDGHIQRVKGRGTFVTGGGNGSWRLQSSEGFFQEEVSRLGHKVTSKVLRAERAELPRWATEALELPAGARGVTIERLRFVDGQLALYNVNHLPDRLAGVVLAVSADDSLYERLEEEHGLRVHSGRRVVEAVAAKSRLASLLEVPRGAPLIFIESVSWDDQMRPFDCYQTWLRTDRTRLEVQVTRTSEERE